MLHFYNEKGTYSNLHDIKKETIVMDPMCMDERILCCTHSVTGIFMGSNNTVWQSVSSVCSFILCSENWVLSFHFLTLYWKINVFSMIFSNINRIQFQQTMKVRTVAYIGKTIK